MPNFEGLYAYPACQEAEEFWLITSGMEFFADSEFFYFGDFVGEDLDLPYGWQRYDWYFVRRGEAGGLEFLNWSAEEGVGEEPGPAAWSGILPRTTDDLGPEWNVSTYAPCAFVPAPFSFLHGETVNFLRDLAPASDQCQQPSAACFEALFGAVDRHADGELNTAELSRLFRVLLHLGLAAQDEDEGPATEAALTALTANLAAAPLIATALIASYDYDGSDALSYDEVAGELVGGNAVLLQTETSFGAQARGAAATAGEALRGLLPLLRQTVE